MSHGFNATRKRKIKQALFDANGGVCEYCKFVFPYERLTLDHRKRKREGGGNDGPNLILSCEPCNQAREASNEKARATWKRKHAEYVAAYAIEEVIR